MLQFLSLFIPMFRTYVVYTDQSLITKKGSIASVPIMILEHALSEDALVNLSYIGQFKTFEWLWMHFEIDGGPDRVVGDYLAMKG